MSEQTEDKANSERVRQYRTPKRGQRRVLTGRVVANKMSKTLTVLIERTERHRKYGKYIRRHSKVYAHDAEGKAKVGDLVKVIESRPFSKLKRFALLSVESAGGESS